MATYVSRNSEWFSGLSLVKCRFVCLILVLQLTGPISGCAYNTKYRVSSTPTYVSQSTGTTQSEHFAKDDEDTLLCNDYPFVDPEEYPSLIIKVWPSDGVEISQSCYQRKLSARPFLAGATGIGVMLYLDDYVLDHEQVIKDQAQNTFLYVDNVRYYRVSIDTESFNLYRNDDTGEPQLSSEGDATLRTSTNCYVYWLPDLSIGQHQARIVIESEKYPATYEWTFTITP